MKKILFFGDSITDMGRIRDCQHVMQYGMGYVFLINAFIQKEYPNQYQIINKGISGDTMIDLMERYQNDVINQNPDIITILIGVNDVWHRMTHPNSKGSKPSKFILLYEKMLIDMKKSLPDSHIIIMEPFFAKGEATDGDERFHKFEEVYKYSKKIKRLAKKLNIPFIKLQKKMTINQEKYFSNCLYDGVHPNVVGASIIATSWMKCFKQITKGGNNEI